MIFKLNRFFFALATCALLANGAAHAAYPDRIVKIVVPFAPGGGTDVVARTLAQELAKELGVSVIIENKPGAGTIIGTQAVAAAAMPALARRPASSCRRGLHR